VFGRLILDRVRTIIALKQKGEPPILVDPAVDINSEKTNLDAFRESHWDIKHLALSGEPTYWTIKPITRKQMKYAITVRHDEAEFWDFMVRAGLRLVENYTLQKPGGERMPTPAVEVEEVGELGELITTKWMDTVNLQSNVKTALCLMIWQISEVHLPLPKPSEPESGG